MKLVSFPCFTIILRLFQHTLAAPPQDYDRGLRLWTHWINEYGLTTPFDFNLTEYNARSRKYVLEFKPAIPLKDELLQIHLL